MAENRNFYIAGAGIAGLTLALALAKFGASVTVLERNASLAEFGAGLQISPNARRVLNHLGLDDALHDLAFEPSGIDVYPFRATAPLVTLALGDAVRDRFGEPYAVMHRADLVDALYRATRRFANIDIVFGASDLKATSTYRGVTITARQPDGETRTGRGFAYIGADGVHSQTRTQMLGGPVAFFRNRAAWRTLLPYEAVQNILSLDASSLLLGPGFHAVCYPLPNRELVNVALFSAMSPDQNTANPTRPNLHPAARKSRQFAALLDAAGDYWGFWPLYTVQTPVWHKANIAIIGDATHAMTPFQAQGAAMAIEDAAILAPLLITSPTAEHAFARYTAIRRPRVERVAKTSASNGKIFNMAWPATIARDFVMRSQGETGHFRRLGWLYDYDGVNDVALGGTNLPR